MHIIKQIIVLLTIILFTLFLIGCSIIMGFDGNTAAVIGRESITMEDINDFKQNGMDNISDKHALDMIIEREVLFKEAQCLGALTDLKDAEKAALNAKNIIESNGTREDQEMLVKQITGLGITYEQYWSEYLPDKYVKLLSVGNIKRQIGAEVYEDIINKYPALSEAEMHKKYDEMYSSRLDKLKKKYRVKYFLK